MKFFCGTDIIEISRIEKAIKTKGKRFLEKIYTEKEIEYCEARGKQKYEHYAVRFAAKEAVYKAISTITKSGIDWKSIEVVRTVGGKPSINVDNLNVDKLKNIDVSLSHCKEYAVANAIAIFEE